MATHRDTVYSDSPRTRADDNKIFSYEFRQTLVPAVQTGVRIAVQVAPVIATFLVLRAAVASIFR